MDEWLRIPSVPDVFAIGDCCGFLESTGKPVLPALAQVRGNTLSGNEISNAVASFEICA